MGGGIVGMEAGRQADSVSQTQGRGGMNINNNARCWKRVTMDITGGEESRWEQGSSVPGRARRARAQVHEQAGPQERKSIFDCGAPRMCRMCTRTWLTEGLGVCARARAVVSHSNYPDDCVCVPVYDLCATCQREPGRAYALYSL